MQVAHRSADIHEMFEDPLGDLFGGGRAASTRTCALGVGGLPQREQPLHLRAIGGQRPPAVGRQPRDDASRSGTSSQTDSAVEVDGRVGCRGP